jgi:hypothetical protein
VPLSQQKSRRYNAVHCRLSGKICVSCVYRRPDSLLTLHALGTTFCRRADWSFLGEQTLLLTFGSFCCYSSASRSSFLPKPPSKFIQKAPEGVFYEEVWIYIEHESSLQVVNGQHFNYTVYRSKPLSLTLSIYLLNSKLSLTLNENLQCW